MRPLALPLILSAAGAAALTNPQPVDAQRPAPPVLVPSMPVGDGVFEDERARRVLAAQILLDRSGHSPGVIDAVMGANTGRAIRAFERAQGLPADGRIDAVLIEALMRAHPGPLLQRHRITEDDVDGPFRNVPAGMTGMSRLDRTAYESPLELLAERFHMSEGLLRALNPGANYGRAGTEVLVSAPGEARDGTLVVRIVIDKEASELSAYAADGTLVVSYPITVGSATYPSPSGRLAVNAVAPAPTYHFDPSGRSWGPSRELTIAPGPNNPVGTVWIDLDRPGFGIHGTPEPGLIGKTSSHGCVRLTNWDVEELAEMVTPGTEVVFT